MSMSISLAAIRRLPRLQTSPRGIRVLALTASILLHLALLLRYGGEVGENAPPALSSGISRVTIQASVAQAPPKATPRKPQTPGDMAEPAELAQQQAALQQETVDNNTRSSSEQLASEARQQQARSAVTEGIAADARQRYLASLLSHIEAHKFYPGAARRRGQEGVIRVSFVLHSASEIGAVHVSGGNSLLQSAALEAVHRSIPFPIPPEGMRFPLQLEFNMRYSLRE